MCVLEDNCATGLLCKTSQRKKYCDSSQTEPPQKRVHLALLLQISVWTGQRTYPKEANCRIRCSSLRRRFRFWTEKTVPVAHHSLRLRKSKLTKQNESESNPIYCGAVSRGQKGPRQGKCHSLPILQVLTSLDCCDGQCCGFFNSDTRKNWMPWRRGS
jgi:hypothetical protein